MADTTRAPRDDNRVPSLLGVSSLDEKTPFPVHGNQSNHALFTESKPSEDHIGEVGGKSVEVKAQLTRPNNTTTYAAGDEVSNSASAPTIMTFVNCARVSGGSGTITNVIMTDSANVSTKGSFELWLFNASSAPTNDNSAAAPTNATNNTLIGVVPLTLSYVGDADAGADGNAVYMGTIDRSLPFVCERGSTSLYGRLIVRNAYVPVAVETFVVKLFIDQN